MQPTISEFLREVVYPRIDAVDRGLLNDLKPGRLSSSGAYILACPSCGAMEGFYYPYSTHINCPRKNECGVSTSIWDAMLKCGYENSEIVKVLCETAGVEPPKSERDIASATSAAKNQSQALTPGKAIYQVTQHLAKSNPSLAAALQKDRGLTDEQMRTMRLGVYTTPQEVLALLKEKGVSQELAETKGYVELTDDNPPKLKKGMSSRLVGYWPHPDGDIRLWGRIPVGGGEKGSPKYRFSGRLKKDIPYLFSMRKNSTLVAVEGTLDAWALQFADLWGCAIGQSSINPLQAAFLSSKGVTEVAHMVDGDSAGYEGGITSIRNCEAAGIVTSIIPLGEGMDDADALRQKGKSDDLQRLVNERINAGEYLAKMCAYYLSTSPPDLRAINKVVQMAGLLTPVSAAVWNDHKASLGIVLDAEREAALIYAGLVQTGLTVTEAATIVHRRTGFRISIAMEDTNNG